MDFLFPAGRKLEPGWYAGLAGYDEFAAVRIRLQTEKHPRVMGLPASSGSEAVRRGAAKGRRIAGSDPQRSRFREQRRGRAGHSVCIRLPSAIAAQSRSAVAGMSTWRMR